MPAGKPIPGREESELHSLPDTFVPKGPTSITGTKHCINNQSNHSKSSFLLKSDYIIIDTENNHSVLVLMSDSISKHIIVPSVDLINFADVEEDNVIKSRSNLGLLNELSLDVSEGPINCEDNVVADKTENSNFT